MNLESNKKARKGAFILILVLLLIFLPITGYITYLKATGQDKSKPKENINKELFFENQLWFYDEFGTLLGKYECVNPTGICTYALNKNYDYQYSIDYYNSEDEVPIKMIDNRYAFLTDTTDQTNKDVFLYDIVNELSYKSASYKNVKNYGVGIENNLVIIESFDGYYGVMQLKDTPKLIIPFQYSFIGLQNELNEKGEIIADHFIVNKSGKWFIIDQKEAVLTESIQDEIVAFTGQTIITKDSMKFYHLVNYQGEKVIPDQDYIKLSYTGRYLNVTKANAFYVYDIENNKIVSNEYQVLEKDEFITKINDEGRLEIILNGEVLETITVSNE